MQLDRTHVVIRLRALSEIGDLALVMIRRYPSSLLVGFALGALPWAIANFVLLGGIPLNESKYGFDDPEAFPELTRYMMWMTLLVILQTPAAGVFTTYYLGQAVFEQRPPWRSVFREVRRLARTWVWVLGVTRMAIPTMFLLAFRMFAHDANPLMDVMLPIVLVVVMAVQRSSRPFLPEILLLEQCPLRSKNKNEITSSRRSKSLHTPVASDLGGRFFAVAFVLFWILLSTIYSLLFVRGIGTGAWSWDLFVYVVIFPLALWMVAGLSCIVRLLSYLDTRIRLEGWEVELAIRAEAMRQFGEDAGWMQRHRVTPSEKRRPQKSGTQSSQEVETAALVTSEEG